MAFFVSESLSEAASVPPSFSLFPRRSSIGHMRAQLATPLIRAAAPWNRPVNFPTAVVRPWRSIGADRFTRMGRLPFE
jgi:hypothetical protein